MIAALIKALLKIGPLVLLGFFFQEQVKVVAEKAAQFSHFPEVILTKNEMGGMTKELGSYIMLHKRPPRSLRRYLNEKFAPENPTRDYSEDLWKTRYKLVRQNRVYFLLSAGPDRQFKTEDDISAEVRVKSKFM